MNSEPIALRLASGSVTPASRFRKRSSASTATSGMLELVAEGGDDLLALVLAHEPVVDEHAGQLVPDRAVDEHAPRRSSRRRRTGRRSPCRCPPASGCARSAPRRSTRRSRPCRSRRCRARNVVEDRLPVGRVHDLGVELDAVDARARRSRAPRRASSSTTPARRTRAGPRRPCRGATSSTSACPAARRAGGPCSRTVSSERPNSPTSAPSTRPPSSRASSCMP